MMPIYLARMGMAEELDRQIDRTISTWIAFPQGFGLYGGYEAPGGKGANTKRSTRDRFIKADIFKLAGEHKEDVVEFNLDKLKDMPDYHSTLNLWNFRHFDYETLPILSGAINEMLIQSYEGKIRLFPSIMPESSLSFKLAAQGGFTVYAVYDKGEFAAVVESNLGNELKIAFHNICGDIEFWNMESSQKICPSQEADTYCVPNAKGAKILIRSKNADKIVLDKDCNVNMNFKFLGDASLGCAREL